MLCVITADPRSALVIIQKGIPDIQAYGRPGRRTGRSIRGGRFRLNAAGCGVCGWRFRVRRTGPGGVGLRKLSAELQIGLDQVVLQQYFQGVLQFTSQMSFRECDRFRMSRDVIAMEVSEGIDSLYFIQIGCHFLLL